MQAAGWLWPQLQLGHRYLDNVLTGHDVYIGHPEVSKLTGPPRHAHPSPSQSEAKITDSGTQFPGLNPSCAKHCATWAKVLNLSVPPWHHLQDNSALLLGPLSVKHLAQRPAGSQGYGHGDSFV